MREASAVLAPGSLRRRAITAFSLGPLVIAAILLLPTPGFALLFSAVLLVAAWEWCGLSGLDRREHRLLYLAAIGGSLLLLWMVPAWQAPLMVLAAVWWVYQAVAILRVRSIRPAQGPEPMQLLVGALVLLAPWAALMSLHGRPDVGSGLVLALFVLMWTADSLAYFVGRRWGRAKLAPVVSPGKTRIGVYGAMLGAVVFGLLLSWMLGLDPVRTLAALAVCGLAALVSVVGDLYESLLKRRRGMKDSSQLLPGHGGLLDRIDSLTAAAPLFALGMSWALT